MIKFSYLFLDFVFFAPVLIFAFLKYKKLISENKKFIWFSTFAGVVLFFIVDPIATFWNAWNFDRSKTLGIYIGKSNLEELIFSILVCLVVAVALLAGIRSEKNKQG
jgi:lycopene cyclase domain-containing protein